MRFEPLMLGPELEWRTSPQWVTAGCESAVHRLLPNQALLWHRGHAEGDAWLRVLVRFMAPLR